MKATLFVVSLALCLGIATVAKAGGKDPLHPDPVRPGSLDYRTESPGGYLKVYSATDKFKDGDAWYFPHSSYAIYTISGNLFKSVRNQRSSDDEIPEVVALPVGTYAVVARSEKQGYIRTLVVIKEAQQTVLDLDLWGKTVAMRMAHN